MTTSSGAYRPDDERAAELLWAIFGGGAMVCLARCEPCQPWTCVGCGQPFAPLPADASGQTPASGEQDAQR